MSSGYYAGTMTVVLLLIVDVVGQYMQAPEVWRILLNIVLGIVLVFIVYRFSEWTEKKLDKSLDEWADSKRAYYIAEGRSQAYTEMLNNPYWKEPPRC